MARDRGKRRNFSSTVVVAGLAVSWGNISRRIRYRSNMGVPDWRIGEASRPIFVGYVAGDATESAGSFLPSSLGACSRSNLTKDPCLCR